MIPSMLSDTVRIYVVHKQPTWFLRSATLIKIYGCNTMNFNKQNVLFQTYFTNRCQPLDVYVCIDIVIALASISSSDMSTNEIITVIRQIYISYVHTCMK